MNKFFISDLHLNDDQPHIISMFKSYLESLIKKNKDDIELYIIGDLFESWVGDDHKTPLNKDIKNALLQLTTNNIKTYFLYGNRDFLIGNNFLEDTGVILISDPDVFTYKNKKVLISHGDEFCTDDIEYQMFRKIVRNKGWQKDFLGFPISKRLKIAGEAKDASQNSKEKKSMNIMDVNQAAIEKAINIHQVDLIIHGHTHRPAKHIIESNSHYCERFVLGDWTDESAIILDWSNEDPVLIDLTN
ncbi:MAG: UDP-2,3-diacylglucosamine diphosphatase [Gammaproteobacteria bacterium]|nr:UDP-2,3-diacylglucosamine diphosphatase [Gammaproteobacteria bacterium]